MDDDLRTAIVEFIEDNHPDILLMLDPEKFAENLEKHLNEIGYAFYDERFSRPVKL